MVGVIRGAVRQVGYGAAYAVGYYKKREIFVGSAPTREEMEAVKKCEEALVQSRETPLLSRDDKNKIHNLLEEICEHENLLMQNPKLYRRFLRTLDRSGHFLHEPIPVSNNSDNQTLFSILEEYRKTFEKQSKPDEKISFARGVFQHIKSLRDLPNVGRLNKLLRELDQVTRKGYTHAFRALRKMTRTLAEGIDEKSENSNEELRTFLNDNDPMKANQKISKARLIAKGFSLSAPISMAVRAFNGRGGESDTDLCTALSLQPYVCEKRTMLEIERTNENNLYAFTVRRRRLFNVGLSLSLTAFISTVAILGFFQVSLAALAILGTAGILLSVFPGLYLKYTNKRGQQDSVTLMLKRDALEDLLNGIEEGPISPTNLLLNASAIENERLIRHEVDGEATVGVSLDFNINHLIAFIQSKLGGIDLSFLTEVSPTVGAAVTAMASCIVLAGSIFMGLTAFTTAVAFLVPLVISLTLLFGVKLLLGVSFELGGIQPSLTIRNKDITTYGRGQGVQQQKKTETTCDMNAELGHAGVRVEVGPLYASYDFTPFVQRNKRIIEAKKEGYRLWDDFVYTATNCLFFTSKESSQTYTTTQPREEDLAPSAP